MRLPQLSNEKIRLELLQILVGLFASTLFLAAAALNMPAAVTLAALVLIATAIAITADLFMMLGLRLADWIGEGAGMLVGIAMRWSILGTSLYLALTNLQGNLPVLVFVGSLIGVRIVATLLLATPLLRLSTAQAESSAQGEAR